MLSSFQGNVSQNGFEGRNEGIFYLMMQSTHFYLWLCHPRYMVKNQIVREETRYCHIVHSFWLAASFLYMPQPTHRWNRFCVGCRSSSAYACNKNISVCVASGFLFLLMSLVRIFVSRKYFMLYQEYYFWIKK